MNCFNQLQNLFHLNQKDFDIYSQLLQSGPSAASTLASRTEMDRTTVYAVLKRLIKKGFIVSTSKKKITIFIALEPETLEGKLMQEITQKKNKLDLLKSILPELNQFKNVHGLKPAILIFEGAQAVISLYELMLRSSKEQDAFLTIDVIPKPLQSYLKKDYILHKRSLGVKSRVLVEESIHAFHYQKMDHKSNRVTKIITRGHIPFQCEIIISQKEEVAMIDFSHELIGVHIQSNTIRNTLKAIFDHLWEL